MTENNCRDRRAAVPLPAIYIGRVDALRCTPEDIRCPERRAALLQPQHEQLRRCRLATWRLLQTGLRHALGLEEEDCRFTRQPNGKWCCDRAFLSLSHTDGWAACALSDAPVGVDMEETGPFGERFRDEGKRQRVAERIAQPAELEAIREGRLSLLQLWLFKESVYKASDEPAFVPPAIDTLAGGARMLPLPERIPVALAAAGSGAERACVYLYTGETIERVL